MILKNCSEDMKVAVTECFRALFTNASSQVQENFVYCEDFKSNVSHLVFQALEWAENEEGSGQVVVSR